MTAYTLELSSYEATNRYVFDNHFGANALHSVNTDDSLDFSPSEGFQDAIENHEINYLRYPGGHVENTIDVTRLENGKLRSEIVAFLEWCRESGESGIKQHVTFVLPTKTDIPASRMSEFVELLLREYGDLIDAFEIGNEYSIGIYERDADRSTHPEDNPESSFVSSQTESEYGIAANRVINAVQDAIDTLHSENPLTAYDPKILIQMAETNGAASVYKNGGNYDLANEAILSWLDSRALDAIDGAVAHYYYNQEHLDDPTFDHNWQEVRRLDERHANFVEHLGRDVPMVITEWNVVVGNQNQAGMASASIILEMFEFMVQTGVSDAHIWPLQHRTVNNILGNWSDTESSPSLSGAVFSMMNETLRPVESEIGASEQFESISSVWTGHSGQMETTHFASQYHEVIYVSNRSLVENHLELDISSVLENATNVTVRHLSMDTSTSDGLSDFADENGLNRISRRYVDEAEMDLLRTLPFFDEENANHIKIDSAGNYRSYLPSYWGIIPLVDNPQDISDYYFASEADTQPLITDIENTAIISGIVQANFLPYDIIEVVIERVFHQEGTDLGERIYGGFGVDEILGRGGNDYIKSGEFNDTVKGGFGDDTIYAGSDNDYVSGGGGADWLYGEDGNDTIHGGIGNDTIRGGNGFDRAIFDVSSSQVATFSIEGSTVTLQSADGIDVISDVEVFVFEDATFTFASLNQFTGPAEFAGTLSDDVLICDTEAADLMGYAGDDVLTSGDFDDCLDGGDGHDTLSAGRGNDLLDAGEGNDLLLGLGGNDTLYGGAGNDTIKGGREDDVIDAGDGDDSVVGQRNRDTINGGDGRDTIKGGGGADEIYGEHGDDFLKGGTKADFVKGQMGDDTLSGNRHDDTLDGGWGADILNGGGDNDRLIGGGDNDTLKGGDGADVFVFAAGHDMDVIEDFTLWIDTLQLDSALVGGQSATEIAAGAQITADGVLLDFGGGDQILLAGLTSSFGLSADIDIV